VNGNLSVITSTFRIVTMLITCLQTMFHIVSILTKFHMPDASGWLSSSKLRHFSNGKELMFYTKRTRTKADIFGGSRNSVSLRPVCRKIGSTVLECLPLAQCTLQVSCNHFKVFKYCNCVVSIVWRTQKAYQSIDLYCNS